MSKRDEAWVAFDEVCKAWEARDVAALDKALDEAWAELDKTGATRDIVLEAMDKVLTEEE